MAGAPSGDTEGMRLLVVAEHCCCKHVLLSPIANIGHYFAWKCVEIQNLERSKFLRTPIQLFKNFSQVVQKCFTDDSASLSFNSVINILPIKYQNVK